MTEPLRCVAPNTILTGWDFSTGSVKCLAFDLQGNTLAEVRLPTELYTEGGVSELSLFQLEGQARATVRAMAGLLREQNRLIDWKAGGISATHHTAGRIDVFGNQVRRAICWNDQTLAEFHELGQARLGGPQRVHELIGGPWAVRYSLSHLVKDEKTLALADWQRTWRILPHGPAAAGYLTGRFDACSISSAASTGLLDLRTNQWCRDMLDALELAEYRELAWRALPKLVAADTPLGPLSPSLALEAGLALGESPLVFPTDDDQAAGLIGGGAADAGQVAIILGNSAVVNSSAAAAPHSGTLDAMKLNWGPYLWMRCYSNGAQFLDRIVGPNPDWAALEQAARAVPANCNGVSVMPFALSEPALGVKHPWVEWIPHEPSDIGTRYRAALEAIAFLVALGVREHEAAGQSITRITLSGGIAKSDLMGEILATLLDRRLERLQSSEGPALGVAITALAGLETHLRRQQEIAEPFRVGDAVRIMVKFRTPVDPNPLDRAAYQQGLQRFAQRLPI